MTGGSVMVGGTTRFAGLWGVLAAVTLHAGAAATLASMRPGDGARRARPMAVEVDLVEPPPSPPPQVIPEPPVPPPRVAMRRKPPPPPPETPLPVPPPEAPPPPETPVDPTPTAFGVPVDSVLSDPSAMAVPVGQTLATADRSVVPPAPAPVPTVAGQGPPAFSPAPEGAIGKYPETLYEAKAEYPTEALRLGLEARVQMRVGIDRRGQIRSVRVLKKAGNGFDEAAVSAMWKFKFGPARGRDGQAVDLVITYWYTFQAPR